MIRWVSVSHSQLLGMFVILNKGVIDKMSILLGGDGTGRDGTGRHGTARHGTARHGRGEREGEGEGEGGGRDHLYLNYYN